MAQNIRGVQKQHKKDQQVRREVRQDVGDEVRPGGSQPIIRQPNRDQARGDWDRTGYRQDIDPSRAPDGDEGVDRDEGPDLDEGADGRS